MLLSWSFGRVYYFLVEERGSVVPLSIPKFVFCMYDVGHSCVSVQTLDSCLVDDRCCRQFPLSEQFSFCQQLHVFVCVFFLSLMVSLILSGVFNMRLLCNLDKYMYIGIFVVVLFIYSFIVN